MRHCVCSQRNFYFCRKLLKFVACRLSSSEELFLKFALSRPIVYVPVQDGSIFIQLPFIFFFEARVVEKCLALSILPLLFVGSCEKDSVFRDARCGRRLS